jgi:hypothetical protein
MPRGRARVVALPLHASLLGRYAVALANPAGCVAWPFRGEDLALVIFVFANVDDTVGGAGSPRPRYRSTPRAGPPSATPSPPAPGRVNDQSTCHQGVSVAPIAVAVAAVSTPRHARGRRPCKNLSSAHFQGRHSVVYCRHPNEARNRHRDARRRRRNAVTGTTTLWYPVAALDVPPAHLRKTTTGLELMVEMSPTEA